MSKQRSSSILKSMITSMSDKDLTGSLSKQRSFKKKKKKLKTKNSDAGLSHRRSDSEHNRSTNLAGLSSSNSLSTLPEKDANSNVTQTPVLSKTKVSKEYDLDKEPISIGNTLKSKKNKSERVVVHVRVRPFSKSELEKKQKSAIIKFDTDINLISIRKDKTEGTKAKFYFDSLFDDQVTQENVYEVSGNLIFYIHLTLQKSR